MDRESTHASLLDRVRSLGDQNAWRELDERYRELILRYATRRGLQVDDAEDIRQQVMLRLAKRLPTFVYRPELGRFRDYLGTMVRNLVARHHDRLGRAPAALDEDADVRQDVDDEAWEQEWMLHHYRLAMARIRTEFRATSLAVFDGLLSGETTEELGRHHGLRPEAIYKIKQRVRDRLRELVEQQIQEEEFAERRHDTA